MTQPDTPTSAEKDAAARWLQRLNPATVLAIYRILVSDNGRAPAVSLDTVPGLRDLCDADGFPTETTLTKLMRAADARDFAGNAMMKELKGLIRATRSFNG